jgi:hypothetical protein
MAKTREINLGPWRAGIDNKTRDYVMQRHAVLDAFNVDFTDEGHAVMRGGFSNCVAMDYARSLSNEGSKVMLAWGDNLGVITGVTPLTITTLRGGIDPLLSVAYAHAPGKENEVWWSNGVASGRCNGDNTDSPWAVPGPSAINSVFSGAGTLAPGTYRIALTHSMESGEESIASPIVSFTLNAAGSLIVILPAAASGVDYFNIYCTTTDGSVLQKYASVTAVTASVNITDAPSGRMLGDRAFLGDLPPGDILAFFHGRLLSAKGDYIYFSDPYDFGHCNLAKNYIRVSGKVTIMSPCENGVYVVADRTYWYEGADIATAEPREVLPFGAVKGTGFAHPEDNVFGWFSEFGFVLGDQQGNISTPHAVETKDLKTNFMAPQALSGKTWVRKIGGLMHVICSLDSTAHFDERVSNAFKASLLRYAPDPSTVCMNLATGAVSRYTNWHFNSFAQINDQYYAVDSRGMWLLEGSNDNGSPIISGIDLGRIGFHSNNLKHVPNVYVSGKSSANTVLSVTTSSGLTYDYSARSFDVAAKVQRHDLGRGLRETWYGLVVRNAAGSSLEVSGVLVIIADSPRKI